MKKTLCALLAFMMTTTLAACGGGNTSTSASSAASASPAAPASSAASEKPAMTENVTIKFANYAILESGYEAFWNGVKSGFETKHPNIKIEYVTAPYGEIVNQVINMAGGGDKVDLVFSEVSWIPTFEDAGLAVPVNKVVTDEYLSDFYPSVLDAHKVGDQVYGLPMYMSPYVLYYNKDLFTQAGLDPNAPPKTYDEMLVMAEKLSQLKSVDGNKVYAFGQTTASVPVSGSSLNGMVYNFGGTVLTPDGKLGTNTPEFKQAFEMLKTLDTKGFTPQNAKLKDLRNLFALGQLAMYYDQSWGFNGVSSINPEAKNFTASAAPLAGGSGKGTSIVQSQCLVMMDNGDAQREAVRLLVEYMMTEEVIGEYITNVTPAYPVKKAMSNMPALKDNPVLKGAASSVENVMACPQIPALNDLNLELCTLAQAVTVGGKSFDEAYPAFEKAASALIG